MNITVKRQREQRGIGRRAVTRVHLPVMFKQSKEGQPPAGASLLKGAYPLIKPSHTCIIPAMTETTFPTFVHLVGSMPLENASRVFQTASHLTGKHLLDVPDGETGERKSFVQWQRTHIPAQVRKPLFEGTPSEGHPPVQLTLEDIQPLRYDDFAIESYKEFVAMRNQGLFAKETRFQVDLPTPASVVRSLVETEYCAQVEQLYEARMLQVLSRLQKEIPPQDLTIQWDMPIEIAMLELERGKLKEPFFRDFFKPYFSPVKQGIMDRLERLAKAISPQVKMGYHMCYGNYKQKHWLEPENVDLLVDITNSLWDRFGHVHTIDYVHMPVPKYRTDAAYLEPLSQLQDKSTVVVLGLVHGFDLEGTKKRCEIAKLASKKPFGITTECGMTNKTVEYLESVLQISAAVVEAK